MALLLFLAAITGWRNNILRIIRMIITGMASVIAAVIPVGIGLLMGKSFYGASAEFLVGKDLKPVLPDLSLIDYLSMTAIVILILYQIIKWRQGKSLIAVRFTVLLGMAVFAIYYYGGVATQNIVVSSRAGELWGLTVPVVLGMGWYGFSQLIAPLRHKAIELLLGLSVIAYIVLAISPQPIMPYKMEYDSGVEQYLCISSMYKSTDWMIVSQVEGFALAYGKGYHMMLGDFLRDFSPYDNGFKNCAPNIFIYHEKKVFWPDLDSTIMDFSIYKRREEENQELNNWLVKYENTHQNINTFYEDENLKIVHIEQYVKQEDMFQKLWGNP